LTRRLGDATIAPIGSGRCGRGERRDTLNMTNVSANRRFARVPAAIGILICAYLVASSNGCAGPMPCLKTPEGSMCPSPTCDVNITSLSSTVGAHGFTASVKDDPAWKPLVDDKARRALVLDFLTCRTFESPGYQGFDCPNNQELVKSRWADLYDSKSVSSAPLLHACKCGKSGGECCSSGEPCDPSLICHANECQSCGAVGQFCCMTGAPCMNSICANKVCVKSRYQWGIGADRTDNVKTGECAQLGTEHAATCDAAHVGNVIAWPKDSQAPKVERRPVGTNPYAQGTSVEIKDDTATIHGWSACGGDQDTKISLHTVVCEAVPDR
jgi:hypothetical protein